MRNGFKRPVKERAKWLLRVTGSCQPGDDGVIGLLLVQGASSAKSKFLSLDARNQRISERVKQGYRMRGLKNTRPFSEIDLNGDSVVDESVFLQMQAQHRQSRFE